MSATWVRALLRHAPRPLDTLFALAAAAAVNLQRLVDPDLFWHLRAGADIRAAGTPVVPDTWNYLFQGGIWVNQQWLTEVLMSRLYEAWGYTGLMVLKGAVAAAVVLCLLGALRRRPAAVRYLAVAAVVAADWRFFLFRTHTLSMVAMAALIFLLERVSPRTRLFWVVPLFALWANLHGFIVLGLAVLGTVVGGRLAEKAWKARGEAGAPWAVLSDGEHLWEVASLPLAAAATLLNPFGVGVWKTILGVGGHRETFLISEWRSVWSYPLSASWAFLAFASAALILGIWGRKRVSVPWAAVAALFFGAGLWSVRLGSVFPLVAAPLLAGGLEGVLGRPREVSGGLPWRRLRPALMALFAVGVGSVAGWSLAHPIRTPESVPRRDYPVRAVRWMQEQGLNGRIFNEFDWGGYLSLHLPDSRTFIDGRTGVLLFPWDHPVVWRRAIDLEPGWREVLERGRPDFALLFADDYLAYQLAREPGWRLLYRDDLAVLVGRVGE